MTQFLVIGNEIGDIYDEPKKILDFKNDYYVYLGKDMFDSGIDMIDLNQEMYDWLYDHRMNVKDIGIGTIIKVIKLNENNYIKIPNNLKDATVWSVNMSYDCSKTIEDLEKRYI